MREHHKRSIRWSLAVLPQAGSEPDLDGLPPGVPVTATQWLLDSARSQLSILMTSRRARCGGTPRVPQERGAEGRPR